MGDVGRERRSTGHHDRASKQWRTLTPHAPFSMRLRNPADTTCRRDVVRPATRPAAARGVDTREVGILDVFEADGRLAAGREERTGFGGVGCGCEGCDGCDLVGSALDLAGGGRE